MRVEGHRRSWIVIFATCAALTLCAQDFAHSASDLGIAATAYPLLAERVTENRTGFYVYRDADSGFNHGFPSGYFGTPGKVHLDSACVDDPEAAGGCSSDQTRVDRARGTVLRLAFDSLGPGEYAGVNIEEPEGWAEQSRGIGYDLRPATQLVFDVRSPTGIKIQVGVGGCTGVFFEIPPGQAYATRSIPLSSLSCPPDLASVHLLFTVVTNDANAPTGGILLLDNIRFEPTPARQPDALGFPLSTQTFGVVPVPDPASSRVPIPPDQLNRNLTTIYEAAVTLLALLARGTADDHASARLIAETLAYAVHHDNQGLPLPVGPDGSTGLHSGYMNGDLALLNGQTLGGAKAGDVRLAGFSASETLCGPSRFCLVLDGATGGNNAFAILALAAAYRQFGEPRYLEAARTIGQWLYLMLQDSSGTGFGGYYLGYPDGGAPKVLLKGKSVENNADVFAAFTVLAALEAQRGNGAQAAEWTRRACIAGDFVMEMFDATTGRFYAGTAPSGTPPGDGICLDGPRRGDDVANTCDFLDSNTFATLALAAAPRYRTRIDWRRPIQFVLNRFSQSVTTNGQQYDGFTIVKPPTAGPDGIAWEFTGQAVAAMRFVDGLYRESGFEGQAQSTLTQIRQAQLGAPFGDGRGVVASTLQDGESLPPLEQCLSTPFQCIPERIGLAATVWGIFAEQNVNPLASHFFLTVSKEGTGSGTVTSDPPGIACGSDCEEPYPINTTVALTATADAGSTFTGWSGGGCSGTGTCVVTMDQARAVAATFDLVPPPQYLLTVTLAGCGEGSVMSGPPGISCPGDCNESYPENTVVTLTANPVSGSIIIWSGEGCNGSGTCTVTMTQARNIKVIFRKVFTDDPLLLRVTLVKATHVTELRQCVDTLRGRLGLAAFAWTDPTLSVRSTPVKALHMAELRTALNQAYTTAGPTLPSYTDPILTPHVTLIKGTHVSELRAAVRGLE